MDGPDIIGDYYYSRGKSMLATGTIIKLIDYEGNYGIFRLGRRESISGMSAQLTTGADGVAAGAASQFSDLRFVEPGQEDRLFHFRPIIVAVVRSGDIVMPGRVLFPPIPDNVFIPVVAPPPNPPNYEFPMGISIQLKQPGGKWRWGTDLKRDVVVSTPNTPPVVITTVGVGGQDGGFVEAPLIPFLDDLDELYDIFTIFGHIIQVRLINRTSFFWPPGQDLGGAPADNKDYYIILVGEKFVLEDVSDEVAQKVEDREIDYQPIVIAGVPQVTGQA